MIENYGRDGHWRRYWDFLPARIRSLAVEPPPAEERWSWRGMAVHLDRYPLPTAAATVILVHGAGGYGRMFAPYGALLRAAGYEVVAPDLPGYGLSAAPTALFDYSAWSECVAALAAAERVRAGRPVVLLGASVGGWLAYLAAAAGAPVAAVAVTTLADPRQQVVRDQFARNRLLSRLGLPFMPLLGRLAGGLRLPIRWFSKMDLIANDPQLTALILDDALGGGNRVPVHFMASLFAARPALEPEDFRACPLLLMQPAEDRWTTLEASLPAFERLACPKELVMLENCGHFPVEEPGLGQLERALLGLLARVV